MKGFARDDADKASEEEEFARNEALYRATQQQRMQHRGSCYNCGEACGQGLFCDVECRKDYEREKAVRQRQQAQQRSDKEKPE